MNNIDGLVGLSDPGPDEDVLARFTSPPGFIFAACTMEFGGCVCRFGCASQ